MSTMEQVKTNVAAAGQSRAKSLGPAEMHLIAALRKAYLDRAVIPCTKCGYCMPCINGVDVPANFETYNDAFLHDDIPGARFKYKIFIPEPARAAACLACHDCEGRCPQKIEIADWLAKVNELLNAA
jgi:predicted aldo/keto reductase-like oxidoreductase